jgi:hypothetical protein
MAERFRVLTLPGGEPPRTVSTYAFDGPGLAHKRDFEERFGVPD